MRCFDTAKIYVKAGDGGRGMVAFRREAFVAQGGPFGGNGGNGGAIYFEADSSINSLVGFRKKVHHRADPGGNGGGKKMQGSIGADRTVLVPPGTVVRDAKTGRTLCEMFAHGHREMVVPGGRGGRGNASFKTAKNKAPQIAENGEEGMEKWVELELKLVADVGIIGVPNAGKSTLLANVSNAKPKIADYPFTTIVPNLGVVERDFERMVFADIPGLLEGASDGVGLGFEFLRHVKRTRVLVHVLDCTSEDVLEEYDAIRNELFLFDEEVGDKPELIALNKVDASDEAAERALELQTVFEERGLNVHVTSALTGAGVGELITAVKDIWASLPAIDYEAEAAERAAKKLARPADGKSLDEFTVTDTPYAFIIEGAAIERFVQMTNWDYFESFKRFARVLQMSGIEKAVNDAGAGEGDRVIIGKYEFEWSGDRREKTLFDSWRAKMDEKPAGTTQQGSRHWPH
jgi:GTP-binding protein